MHWNLIAYDKHSCAFSIAMHNYAYHKQCNLKALHNYAYHYQCNPNALQYYAIINNLIPMLCIIRLIITMQSQYIAQLCLS